MQLIKPFEELTAKDVAIVGGKNASLGEMIRELERLGVFVPSGFAVTADAYYLHLEENGIKAELFALMESLDKNSLEQLQEVGKKARELIESAPLPEQLAQEVRVAYNAMETRYAPNVSVAVRSSATAEDLPNASFAGQQETYLNVRGAEDLVKICPKAFASLYTDRAISYRFDHGFSQTKLALSIGVQKMVRSDLASAGVIFTLDTESGHRGVVFINSSYGLGENVVKGNVNPDEFYVHKPTLAQGFTPVLKKRKGSKLLKMLCRDDASDPAEMTYNTDTPEEERKQFSLSDDEILQLAKHSVVIEQHYSKLHGKDMPMDIEWAKDGEDGRIYIVQARPETVHSQKQLTDFIEEYRFENNANVVDLVPIVRGKSVGSKITSGPAKVILSPEQIDEVVDGDVVVTTMTDPDWEPIMRRAAAVVTDRGGRTCHAAIVSRELGIPAIVGSIDGTKKIVTGTNVTVDCSGGQVGNVYDGLIPFKVEKTTLGELPEVATDLMINMGDPDSAFKAAMIPNDGVGLARLEFIINNAIRVHPMALVNPELVGDEVGKEIEDITVGYEDKKNFFVDTLAQELGTIVAAFYPKPVIARFSDFKSNEYSHLLGGKFFEPEEDNPMLGFRGACRYSHELYRDAFALECQAVKKVRSEMGLKNLKMMVPFVRTVGEAKRVIEVMQDNMLVRGDDGFELYMMCELPGNVVILEQFAQYFDGFSIGSNDLTQLTLGLDRDSELVANIFDERDEAVKFMLSLAIKGAKKAGKKIGICGQGPSDYPDFGKFLVSQGIDSISLSADAILVARKNLA
ncbi:phosphoenolpyruvate synthase [Candidatus Babeliales bacterium]|nr:phosphoenolpyruvate synthase [Candidatus Babeliales bacterium]